MKRKELGAHHIVPGEAGGTNDDEEIITESTPYKKLEKVLKDLYGICGFTVVKRDFGRKRKTSRVGRDRTLL